MPRQSTSTHVQTKGWRHSSVAVTLLAEMAERRKATGQRVVELREKKRWSQEELATNSGLSVKTISRLENGRYESRRNTIDRVADALGVSADDIDPPPSAPLGLGQEPDAAPASEELQAIREDLSALREEVSTIAEAVTRLLDPAGQFAQALGAIGQQDASPPDTQSSTRGRRGARRAADG